MNKNMQELPMTTTPKDFDPTSPNFYVPHLSEALGNSALRHEVHISDESYTDENGVINRVPGIVRAESVESEVIINPQTDRGKIPGTEEYARRQEELSNLAHSEVAASNAHSRKY